MAPILPPRTTKGKNQPPPNSPSKIPTAIYPTVPPPQKPKRVSHGHLFSSHNTARVTSAARTTTHTTSKAPPSTNSTSNALNTTRTTPTTVNTTRTTSIVPTSTHNAPNASTVSTAATAATTPTVLTAPRFSPPRQSAAEELRQRRKARLQELCADNSVNCRHLLEVLQLIPLNWSRGERPDPYLKSLLANQMIPHDKECELALAITFAKENWWYFATWPKDVKKFAELERDKRRREWEQRQREWEQRHWEWIEKWERERGG
ncbi:hypothetical protein COCC4DRAFT_146652 [Bipolaris maydis ATCC 48331]|uniref:Uncharacterized protein n=2 Tax=Cochliobolus heterostrophus TaxID=5016 RepID=M2SL25_COCH5|nr:uncharacterized protein COCC4DRAFT_146652 [Bipolaris maydis ATCC 48331]EMD86025.1 hypothetical protein COCHEDRAFT_1035089 [Bipolaris maydis C5]KAJ5028199.1 hypothetical protein J3E73DRAFT_256108 [Bipolaris maydis]ENI02028.1 hypothetical protein COCC4DRAFT_146652 [Bipolaris maydis ATCC 48331]KAJ5062976.1 hypothetical protein J3E74DRAFT_288646 [Bipolaris maydis]KAJ6203942.1 hypothetical protein PSV09DRAFT_1035089 [Bipolaris maydis]